MLQKDVLLVADGDGTRVITASCGGPTRLLRALNEALFRLNGAQVLTASNDGLARLYSARLSHLRDPHLRDPAGPPGRIYRAWSPLRPYQTAPRRDSVTYRCGSECL